MDEKSHAAKTALMCSHMSICINIFMVILIVAVSMVFYQELDRLQQEVASTKPLYGSRTIKTVSILMILCFDVKYFKNCNYLSDLTLKYDLFLICGSPERSVLMYC